jgi:hypothetical protein
LVPGAADSFLAFQHGVFFWETRGNRHGEFHQGFLPLELQAALQQIKDAPLNRSG